MKLDLKFLGPLIAFIGMAILLGVGLTLNPRDLPSTLIGKLAPAFDLPRLYQADQQIKIPEHYLGKRWILNVWASWCVGCRVEHPLLNELAQKTDIPLLGLNYKDDGDNARQWLAERGNPYSIIAADFSGNAGIDWGVYGVPETYVIDELGLVIYKHTGPLDVDAVRNELLPLFKGVEK